LVTREPDVGRVYLFADEAGNFDFSRRQGATRYFILGTVTTPDTSVGSDLVELRRDLAWQGVGLETTFHATEDKQVVRDAVFSLLQGANFRADFTVFEKSKTVPHRQNQDGFYKLAWFEHMKHVGPRVARRRDELLVIASSIGTKKKRRTTRLAIEDVVDQVAICQRWEVAFWPCESDPCLQLADYCTWAVQRKWEHGDDRSYKLIAPKITTEFDYFQWGTDHYY
jgi:hypothetical protein